MSLGALLDLGSCNGEPAIILDITSWPAEVTQLLVKSDLDGVPGKDAVVDVGAPQIVFRLPEGSHGTLNVQFTGIAGQNCVAAQATFSEPIPSGLRNFIQRSLALTPVSPKQCLQLTQVKPALGPTAGGAMLQLSGDNFAPGTTVTIDGVAATNVVIGGPTSLTAILPPRPGAIGKVAVVVRTPAGRSVTRSDLFSYYASALSFQPAAIPVGTGPAAIAVGDFNGDQKPDLVVPNKVANSVSVMLGNGMGSFATPTVYPTATGPAAVAVGDFNGDGKLDFALANSGVSTASVLSGDGKGNFSAAANSFTGTSPLGVAVGDFNGDGFLDMATANSGSGNVSALLGNGTSGFSVMPYSAGTAPVSVIAGDFNADQKPDLVVANPGNNTVSLLIGSGSGTATFAVPTSLNFGTTGPKGLAVGDFNGDQRLDLVVANQGGNVSVHLGTGFGNFNTAALFSAGTTPVAVAVGDFNGDQKLDLAVVNQDSNNVSLLLGNGMGSFVPTTNVAVGMTPVGVAVGDFNGDGRPDLAVCNQGSANVTILINQSK